LCIDHDIEILENVKTKKIKIKSIIRKKGFKINKTKKKVTFEEDIFVI
jgi:hypothetical protein